jgi:hypothetical protein
MDAQFQATTYIVISQFLEKLSDRCDVKKEQLWKLWKDMFNDFPKEPSQKPKVSKKKEVPEQTIHVSEKPVQVIPDKTVPEKTVPEKTVPEKTVPEKTVPEKTVPEKTVPEKTIPEKTVPEKTVPEKTIPEKPISEPSNPIVQERQFLSPIPEEQPSPVSVKPEVKEESPSKTKKTKPVEDGCEYVFTRGDRSGQKCGKKKKGDQFCGTHTK